MRVLYDKMGYRCHYFIKVRTHEITLKEASRELGISYRHTRRLYKKFKLDGPIALLPRKRGSPHNATPDEIKQKIIELRSRRYREFNISHFTEKLKENEEIELSRETVRKILMASGLHGKGKHYPKHRKRFEAPAPGKLVQMDTSPHKWIPALQRQIHLILLLDDHSRKPLGSRFAEHDTTWENMLVLREVIEEYGIFSALYTDNDSKFKYIRSGYSRHFNYKREPDEVETQIDIALRKLDIKLIHSKPFEPEGKGKIERFFGYLQDRLPKEIELAGIKDLDEANKFLKKWLANHSETHIHAITKKRPNERMDGSCFSPILPGVELDDIFCITKYRQVKKDSTFPYNGRDFLLTPWLSGAPWVKNEVELHVVPRRKIRVFYGGRFLQEFPWDGD